MTDAFANRTFLAPSPPASGKPSIHGTPLEPVQPVKSAVINTLAMRRRTKLSSLARWGDPENPPAPKVLGRDRPDGTRKRLQVYLGGGGIFRPKPPVFDRSWRSPSKNTVKNSTEDTCPWTRPSKIGKRKVKKTRVFQLFDLNFLVCNIFFCGSAGGLARRRIFEFLDPFSDWFSSFCDSRNTCFYTVFLFSACLTASFKTSKNLVNYAVLKKHCKLQCFWPPDPQKPWYLQWFLLLTAQKHSK